MLAAVEAWAVRRAGPGAVMEVMRVSPAYSVTFQVPEAVVEAKVQSVKMAAKEKSSTVGYLIPNGKLLSVTVVIQHCGIIAAGRLKIGYILMLLQRVKMLMLTVNLIGYFPRPRGVSFHTRTIRSLRPIGLS